MTSSGSAIIDNYTLADTFWQVIVVSVVYLCCLSLSLSLSLSCSKALIARTLSRQKPHQRFARDGFLLVSIHADVRVMLMDRSAIKARIQNVCPRWRCKGSDVLVQLDQWRADMRFTTPQPNAAGQLGPVMRQAFNSPLLLLTALPPLYREN